jgi:mono/diheme cytochrome c family protein
MKILKWIGIVLGALVGLIVVAGLVVFLVSNGKINKTYTVPTHDLTIPTDAASIAEGERLATFRGCRGCHSDNVAGGVFIADPALGTIYAANLTPGGETADWSASEWERVIRQGVKPDGKPVAIMPANEFYVLNDEDLGKIIAYLKSVDAQSVHYPKPAWGPLGRVLIATGMVPFPAAVVPHNAPRPTAPEPGVTAEYGAYLSTSCTGCHGGDFAGGTTPDDQTELKPNLTSGGEIADWSEEDFTRVLREGVKPDGTSVSDGMPWDLFSGMTDDEIGALWMYIQSLPPLPQNTGQSIPFVPPGS